MFFTDKYKLYAVETGEPLSPLEDSRRFLTIDRQLLGLFQVFGNGVVSGWDVTAAGGLSVSVSAGRGHIVYMSASTVVPTLVQPLTPNADNYVYAQATDTTRYDRSVAFFTATTNFVGGQQVLLAKVTTNSSAATTIDTSVRQDISFIDEIRTLINQHRHRGAPDNPSKIDLSKEVSGRLPGYKLADLDASLITSGRIPRARLPLIDHGSLLNSGVLTHAQLDSFARDLSNSNVRLLGELSATNMLQLYLAYKHIWNEVDAYSTNMLVMVPGITPDSFTDWRQTNAVVDKQNHLIQGVPSLGGELVSTTFRTLADFGTTRNSEIYMSEDPIGAYFRIEKPLLTCQTAICSSLRFDNVLASGVAVPGWTVETVPVQSNTTFESDSTVKVDGAYSAKLDVDQQIRLQVTKVFDAVQDWTQYNEIECSIETISASHGKIIFQLLGLDPANALVEIDSFTLLDTNETTTGFLQVKRDISNVTRDKVKAIRIYTETGSLQWDLSPFTINIDAIGLNNNLYYSPSGRIWFRLRTPQKAHWVAVGWTGDLNGGRIQARARTAPSYETFEQSVASSYSPFFDVSGSDPNVSDNRAIEVELDLAANAGKTQSPVIRSVSISYVTSSTTSGLSVETTDQFLRAAKMENAEVQIRSVPLGLGEVLIDGRVDAGDVVYGMQHSAQQTSLSTSSAGTVFGTSVAHVGGEKLPVSPLQAVSPNFTFMASSIDGAASVERLPDRTYLVADALNDRIILADGDSNPLQIIASNNVRNIKELYPIAVSYNRTNRFLYVAWSNNVTLSTLDVSKITITGAGLSVTLSSNADTVVRLAGKNAQEQASNVSPILLSVIHGTQLEAYFGQSPASQQTIYLNIDPSAVANGFNSDSKNYAALLTPRGFPIFVGNFMFIQGIFRPISITRTASGNWMVGNARPLLTTTEGTDPITGVGKSEISSVIEIVPDTGEVVFSDSSVDFSLLTLGNAIEYNDRYVAEAGIVEGEQPQAQAESVEITASLGGGVQILSKTTTQENAAAGVVVASDQKTDLDVLKARRGVVKIVEKASGRVVFEQGSSDGAYPADVQLDEDGNMVVIEKSFSATSVAGRVIKLDEDGNVFYQFGLAELAAPNDVRVLSTGNMMVST